MIKEALRAPQGVSKGSEGVLMTMWQDIKSFGSGQGLMGSEEGLRRSENISWGLKGSTRSETAGREPRVVPKCSKEGLEHKLIGIRRRSEKIKRRSDGV